MSVFDFYKYLSTVFNYEFIFKSQSVRMIQNHNRRQFKEEFILKSNNLLTYPMYKKTYIDNFFILIEIINVIWQFDQFYFAQKR